MNELLSIKEVVVEFCISEVYLRRLISQNKIRTVKKSLNNTKVMKNFIERSEIEKFMNTKTHTQRSDGRNKYTIYLNAAEKAKLEEVLAVIFEDEEEVSELFKRSNPAK